MGILGSTKPDILRGMARTEIIFEVEESPEGGYVACALSESIVTQATTVEELRKNVREAVRCHFFDAPIVPSIIRLHYVKDEVLSLEAAS